MKLTPTFGPAKRTFTQWIILPPYCFLMWTDYLYSCPRSHSPIFPSSTWIHPGKVQVNFFCDSFLIYTNLKYSLLKKKKKNYYICIQWIIILAKTALISVLQALASTVKLNCIYSNVVTMTYTSFVNSKQHKHSRYAINISHDENRNTYRAGEEEEEKEKLRQTLKEPKETIHILSSTHWASAQGSRGLSSCQQHPQPLHWWKNHSLQGLPGRLSAHNPKVVLSHHENQIPHSFPDQQWLYPGYLAREKRKDCKKEQTVKELKGRVHAWICINDYFFTNEYWICTTCWVLSTESLFPNSSKTSYEKQTWKKELWI